MTPSRLPLAFLLLCNGVPSLSTSAPRLSSTSSCYCPSPALYANEVMPENQAGGGCVGGCDGTDFLKHHEGLTVKTIRAWSGSYDGRSVIRGLELTFSDGTVDLVGSSDGDASSYTFQPGERLDGDVTITGNGAGSRVGYIRFNTNKQGGTFEAGDRAGCTEYNFPSGNSFLAGISGRAGDDVRTLAFVFWKPVASVVLTDISYPTLSGLEGVTSPTLVGESRYCNSAAEPRPFGVSHSSKTWKTGHDACFTSSSTTTFGSEMSVSGSIPDLESIGAKAQWSVSSSMEFKNCDQSSEEHTEGFDFPAVTLPAHTARTFKVTQWAGSIPALPFQATVTVVLTDGTTVSRKDSGTYTGTSFMAVDQYWTDEQTGVVQCGTQADRSNMAIMV